MSAPVLEVSGLSVRVAGEGTPVRPVRGVDLRIEPGEIVGLVGESGCGKTLTSLALMGLLPQPGGVIEAGSIRLGGRELVGLEERAFRKIRGLRVGMIFQDPMLCLNPYLKLGEQLTEGVRQHLGLRLRDARARAVSLLGRVGFPEPERRLGSFPHELSGGMRQRAMIAMALLCEPDLLIADEPTTALDVTIQSQILDLLSGLRAERGTAILVITHDLAVVSELCDRVMVMYAGRIVEEAPAATLFRKPGHPYTAALLRCTPNVETVGRRMVSIEGMPPRLDGPPFVACAFAPRCALVRPECRSGEPDLVCGPDGRMRRCVLDLEEVR